MIKNSGFHFKLKIDLQFEFDLHFVSMVPANQGKNDRKEKMRNILRVKAPPSKRETFSAPNFQ